MTARLVRAACALLAAALLTLAPSSPARAQSCQGSLSKTEYPMGFALADFTSIVQAGIVNPAPNAVTLAPGFLIGQVVSQLISTEIPLAGVGDYTIGKIFIHATASFPAPACPVGSSLGGGSPNRIDLYFSTDNGTSWFLVNFPPGTTTVGDVLIDPLALGVSGNKLMWRAVFISATGACQPRLTGLAVGYEGMPKGLYQNSEAIPAGNVMVRASYELPATAWTDRTPRGHLQAKLLYSLDTVPLTDYTDPLHTPPSAWAVGDAGATITYAAPIGPGAGPDLRSIYFNGGVLTSSPFLTATAGLFQLVLPNAVRPLSYAGQLVYDFDASGLVDDNDAAWLIHWVRGWANGSLRSAPKQWGLGAIARSTPAVVGPPGDPWWLSLNGTPTAERNLFGTPCATPVANTFLQQRGTRNTVVIVGSQDGLFHGFDLGRFRWCDDPGTSIAETRGWFSAAGARNYGDGHEVWAWAPPGEMDDYRRQPARSLPWAVANGLPRSNVDAAVTVADICWPPAGPPVPPPGGNPSCVFKTAMVAPETRNHPYITALDVTDPTVSPKPLWAEDWPPAIEGDTTFQGTELSPSVGPTLTRQAGRRWEAAVTSGITSYPSDLYLYLIDLFAGRTFNNGGVRDGWGRVKLNVAGANADCSGPVYGSAGPPVMVDSDVDGVIDRIYVADTKGCVYKVETGTMTSCVMASLGETVWAPMAVRVADETSSRVELFIGGGDNPDGRDLGPAPSRFHLFALEDDDLPGACNPPKSVFTVDLTPGNPGAGIVHKLWAAPVVASDAVYVATAVGDLNDPCGADPINPGVVEGWQITPSALAGPKQVLAPVALSGNAVGGMRLFDGHLFITGGSGTTTVFGRPSSWATSVTSVNANGGTLFSTPLWQER